ncbi:MAG: lasso peptide biosynthesis B2 protein, partial [Bacteroidales bacterium]|nr:lasso peptide biosynthesis B2 protein [Bacteroidales bacterium]
CLVSSLAGRCMLKRRHITSRLSLGVDKNSGGKFVAHAWLKTGSNELIEKQGEYTELYVF